MKILDLIEDRRPADINDWSDSQLLEFIFSNLQKNKKYRSLISSDSLDYIRSFLENADHISEDVMLQSVQFEPLLLYVFRKFNPSLRVQLAAVQGTGRVIGNIKYPAPLIQWAAFNQDPGAFYHIQPPECCIPEIRKMHEERTSTSTLTEATSYAEIAECNSWSDEKVVRFFKKEAREILRDRKLGYYINGTPNLKEFSDTRHQITAAVFKKCIEFDQSIALYNFARFIPADNISLQLLAVQSNGFTIKHFNNPSPLVQSAACRCEKFAINYIRPIESIDINLLKKYRAELQREQIAYLNSIENTDKDTLTESSKLPTSENLQYWLSKFNPIDYINLWPDNILIEYFKTRYATRAAEISFYDIFEYRNTLSDQVMLELIKLEPGNYDVLRKFHPSLEAQIETLKRSGLKIYYMKNPPPLLQTIACLQNHDAINWIDPIESINISLLKKYRYILDSDQQAYLESLEKLTESDESIDLDDPNTWSEEDQNDYLRSFPGAIKKFKNPNKQIQLVAVRYDSWALRDIKDPDEEVQLAAVTAYPISIRYIKHPSQKVKLAAVSKDGMSLLRINPEERNINVQLAAVMQDPEVIYEIDNPVPLVQTVALKKTPKAINWIRPESAIVPELREKYKDYLYESLTEAAYDADDPNSWTEEQQIDWVRREVSRIKHIKHPSKALQIAAVKEDGWAISQIEPENQCIEAQLIVVREDGHATRIRYMRNPPPMIQWAAIKNNPKVINYIKPQTCIDPSLLKEYGHLINKQ